MIKAGAEQQVPAVPKGAKGRVAHLTSVHVTTDTRVFHRECKSLSAAGYDVTLIAQHPHREVRDGIVIHPVPPEKNRVRRMTKTAWQVYRAALDQHADIYHIHDPELLPIALLLRRHGKNVIYDVHEDLSEDVTNKNWLPVLLRPGVKRMAVAVERFVSRRLSGIVAATSTIANHFPAARTITVQNFPGREEFPPAVNVPYHQRPPQFSFVGSIGVVRGATVMVRALELLREEVEAQLTLVGPTFPPSLVEEFKSKSPAHVVKYVPWMSRPDVAALLGNSRAGMVTFLPGPNRTDCQPVKMFEYMAAGLPVIASDFPLWREFVAGSRCGLLVDPEKPSEIAEAMEWILQNPDEAAAMGERGREAVTNLYNWEAERAKLLALYERILRQNG